MSGSFDKRGNPAWSTGVIASCWGKKRSGKSVMGRVLFDSFPYDRVVISANRDDGPHADPEQDVFLIKGTAETLPIDWPEDMRRDGRRMTIRFEPDTGSPTALEDCDAVLAMVRRHGHTCVLVHEARLIAPSGRVPPHMRRLLETNRHDHVSMILCGPRPITVDPLALAQSDLVYCFELPVPQDRARVAETVGWTPNDFAAQLDDLGRHEYLRFDANELKPDPGEDDLRLVHCDPLPPDVVKEATK